MRSRQICLNEDKRFNELGFKASSKATTLSCATFGCVDCRLVIENISKSTHGYVKSTFYTIKQNVKRAYVQWFGTNEQRIDAMFSEMRDIMRWGPNTDLQYRLEAELFNYLRKKYKAFPLSYVQKNYKPNNLKWKITPAFEVYDSAADALSKNALHLYVWNPKPEELA